MTELKISTHEKRQLVDITSQISKYVPDKGSGVVHLFVQHTTCAVTTIDSDPGIDLDLFDFLSGITPDKQWRHPHNPAHAPAHLLSSIIGPDVTIPFAGGQLLLGTWQRIVLVELDGPRDRNLIVSVQSKSI
ncbi:MAG TPA: secondary thiamine-phosphate synthase enzyme YjbQ [Candidatus Saccharimonadales bacterium]|nr:secondary thiamine-phosphate synthase enzyme YjbQ [Candidatus Saccharimonadales bacterium]